MRGYCENKTIATSQVLLYNQSVSPFHLCGVLIYTTQVRIRLPSLYIAAGQHSSAFCFMVEGTDKMGHVILYLHGVKINKQTRRRRRRRRRI